MCTGETEWALCKLEDWITFPCCFLPLHPFTYSHLSIGTATDTVWGQQTEWGGEWGWGGYGTVCSVCVSSPVCWSANEEVGFGWRATALCPWWSWLQPLMHCLSQHLPSSVWSFVSTCLLHTVHSLCLCVLENPVGEMCPVCCNPVFKVPTFDAFTVATVRLPRLNWHSCLRCITLIWRRKHSISNSSVPSRFDVLESLWHTETAVSNKCYKPNVSQGSFFFGRLNWLSVPVTSSQFLVK